jgi:hypothetical protein
MLAIGRPLASATGWLPVANPSAPAATTARAADVPDIVEDVWIARHVKRSEGFELARHGCPPTPPLGFTQTRGHCHKTATKESQGLRRIVARATHGDKSEFTQENCL